MLFNSIWPGPGAEDKTGQDRTGQDKPRGRRLSSSSLLYLFADSLHSLHPVLRSRLLRGLDTRDVNPTNLRLHSNSLPIPTSPSPKLPTPNLATLLPSSSTLVCPPFFPSPSELQLLARIAAIGNRQLLCDPLYTIAAILASSSATDNLLLPRISAARVFHTH
jgi:hypothetical protein